MKWEMMRDTEKHGELVNFAKEVFIFAHILENFIHNESE